MSTDTQATQLYLVGAGGHCKVVYDAILSAGEAPLTLKIVDGNPARVGDAFMQALPITLFNPELLAGQAFHVAIGDNKVRRKFHTIASETGGQSYTVMHPSAELADSAEVQPGTLVAALAVIGPQALVGCSVIVNHGSVVDHDCRIGDFCHISPNATLGGGVTIGDNVLIGAGAIILPEISICANSVIGAGAVVTRNIEHPAVYVGVPAAAMLEIID